MASNVVNQLFRQVHLVLVSLFMEDGHAGFQVGGLDISHQTHGKAGDEPLLDTTDPAGRAITGQHHLAARLMQPVERVKKLLLCVLLALNELDIVHQDQVCLPVALPEALHPVFADGRDHLVGELLGGDV